MLNSANGKLTNFYVMVLIGRKCPGGPQIKKDILKCLYPLTGDFPWQYSIWNISKNNVELFIYSCYHLNLKTFDRIIFLRFIYWFERESVGEGAEGENI